MAETPIVDAALSRGYSINQIADKLAQAHGLDPSEIRSRGYGSNDIINKLGYTTPPLVPMSGESDDVGVVRSALLGPKDVYAPQSAATPHINTDAQGNPIPIGENAIADQFAQKSAGGQAVDQMTALSRKLAAPAPTTPLASNSTEAIRQASDDQAAADASKMFEKDVEQPEQPQTMVGAGEMALRSYLGEQHSLAKTAGLLASIPAIAADRISSMLHGDQETYAQDYVFQHFVEPNIKAEQNYQLQPNEKTSLLGQIGSGLASLTADLPYMMMAGGAAPEKGAVGTVTPSNAEVVGQKISEGFDVAKPVMVNAGVQKAQQVLDSGGTPQEATASAVTAALTTGYMMAGPMSVEGNWLKRMASGAPMYAGLTEAARMVQNYADPDKLYQPFSTDNLIVNMASGAVLGGAMGHRAPESMAKPDPSLYRQYTQEAIQNAPDTDSAIAAAKAGVEGHAKTVDQSLVPILQKLNLPEVINGSTAQSTEGQRTAEGTAAEGDNISGIPTDQVRGTGGGFAGAEQSVEGTGGSTAEGGASGERGAARIRASQLAPETTPSATAPEGGTQAALDNGEAAAAASKRGAGEIGGEQNAIQEPETGALGAHAGREESTGEQGAGIRRSQQGTQPARTSNGNVVIPGKENQAEVKPGTAPELVGTHFSKDRRESLKGDLYGTGMEGVEARRLIFSEDPRLLHRIHFYVDEGNGVHPEAKVGNVRHDVRLQNLYDASSDPLHLREGKILTDEQANAFESAVLDHGFDGYYAKGVLGKQGAAVLLGDATRGVTPEPEINASKLDKAAYPEVPEPMTQHEAVDSLPEGMQKAAKMMIKRAEEGKRGGLVFGTEQENMQRAAEMVAAKNGTSPELELARINDALQRSGAKQEAFDIAKKVLPHMTEAERAKIRRNTATKGADNEPAAKSGVGEEAGPFAPDAQRRYELAAARRLEQVKKDRESAFGEPGEVIDRPAFGDSDIFSSKAGGVNGFYHPDIGTAFVNTDVTKKEDVPAIVMHEVAHAANNDKLNSEVMHRLNLQESLNQGWLKRSQSTPIYQVLYTPALRAVKTAGRASVGVLRRNFPQLSGSDASRMIQKMLDDGYIRNAGEGESKGKYELTDKIPSDSELLFSKAPVFYSQLERAITSAPEKLFANGKMASEWLSANAGKLGVKKAEIEATGLDDWLKLQGKTSKEDVLNFIRQNGVQVHEVTLGGEGSVLPKVAEYIRRNGMSTTSTAEDWLAFADAKTKEAQQYQKSEEPILANLAFDLADEANQMVENLETPSGQQTGATKFSSYQLPGGENYRELLLKFPSTKVSEPTPEQMHAEAVRMYGEKDANKLSAGQLELVRKSAMGGYGKGTAADFKSTHFDQPNILAHVRFNERTDAEGKRVLFLEELQSDWSQRARKEGFIGQQTKPEVREDENVWVVKFPDGRAVDVSKKDAANPDAAIEKAITRRNEQPNATWHWVPKGVPSAPFVTDTKAWTALALKRMIRYAAENSFDKIAWTTGEQQAARYDLSKQVKSIDWIGDKSGWKAVTITPISGNDIEFRVDENGRTAGFGYDDTGNGFGGKQLDEVIGKDAAEKIMSARDGSLSGNGLKVGGEGMKGYYDQIVPQVANDVLKKLGGGKVESVALNTSEKLGDIGSGSLAVVREDGVPIAFTDYDSQAHEIARANAGSRVIPASEVKSEYGSQQGFTITPELRNKVLTEGQPLFSKTAEASGANIYDRVAARMKAAGVEGDAKEATSYLVEEAMKMGQQAGHSRLDEGFWAWAQKALPESVVNTLKQWVAAVRAAMYRNGLWLKEKDLSIDDFVAVAKANMSALAKGEIEAAGTGELRAGEVEASKKGPKFIKRGEETEPPAALSGAKGFMAKTADKLKELKDLYLKEPEYTDMKRIIGEYTGAMQRIDFELSKVAKQLNEHVAPDRQEAITNYMQAGGDIDILKKRAAESFPEYRKGYEDAMNLTPHEKEVADWIRNQQDNFWWKAHDAGILEGFVENYVRGQWKKDNAAGQKTIALVNSGVLNDKPREAMRKVFENYFEGEQAGFVPEDKRIGYQFTAAQRSIRQAIAARQALSEMMQATEHDGRPTVAVGGGGSMIDEDDPNKPYFVKPNVKPGEAQDYKVLDHPAMRKWKWVGSDPDGKPIMMQGQMLVHPAAYGRLKALLGRSLIRDFQVPEHVPVIGGTKPGEAMLKAGAFIKSTMLIGPFHQFHLAEHATFHGVNPLDVPEIDFDKRPLLTEGVNHGLMLYNHNAMHEFAEGLASGGLIHKLPVIGDQMQRYQEWLFQDYIPRLKAAMYEHAVERALKYYDNDLKAGTFTRDQLLDNAAKQSNAAFGELNYKYMGRDPTLQDALRLALLAPDFLEARFKFFGQALRPRGKEQAMALVRGAIYMATIAQVANLIWGDQKTMTNPKDRWSLDAMEDRVHWDKPFSAVIGGREYTPRSVVGDMMHEIEDPRGFWYNRVNPLWGKPLIELASGRDINGQKESLEDGVKNILKSWIPIPAQGALKTSNSDQTLLQSIRNTMLQSIGVSNYKYRTEAEKKIGNIAFGHRTLAGETAAQKKRYDDYAQLKDDYMSGVLPSMDDVAKKIRDNHLLISRGQLRAIAQSRDTSPEAHILSNEMRMRSFSGDEVMQVWEEMSDHEKGVYRQFVLAKVIKDKYMNPDDKAVAIKEIEGK